MQCSTRSKTVRATLTPPQTKSSKFSRHAEFNSEQPEPQLHMLQPLQPRLVGLQRLRQCTGLRTLALLVAGPGRGGVQQGTGYGARLAELEGTSFLGGRV